LMPNPEVSNTSDVLRRTCADRWRALSVCQAGSSAGYEGQGLGE
jgi:hypothetical protein